MRTSKSSAFSLWLLLLSGCTGPSPTEIVGEDRITLEEASAQVADAITAFRLRLASGELGEDAARPLVPDVYKSGLYYCGVEIKFVISAKANANNKVTLALPAAFNFMGPNAPLSTFSPSLNAEAGRTNDAERGNTITIKMGNPLCDNFSKVLELAKEQPGSVFDNVQQLLQASQRGSLQAATRK